MTGSRGSTVLYWDPLSRFSAAEFVSSVVSNDSVAINLYFFSRRSDVDVTNRKHLKKVLFQEIV